MTELFVILLLLVLLYAGFAYISYLVQKTQFLRTSNLNLITFNVVSALVDQHKVYDWSGKSKESSIKSMAIEQLIDITDKQNIKCHLHELRAVVDTMYLSLLEDKNDEQR